MPECNGSPARYGIILIYFHRFNQALYTFYPTPVFPKMYPWTFVVRLNFFRFQDRCALGVQNGQMWSV